MKPDWRMKRALSVLGSIEEGGSLAEAAKAAGVSAETLIRWFGRSEFREEVRQLTEQESDSVRAEVWRALLDKCRAGDSAAIRLYFDLKDRKKEKAEIAPAVIVDDIPPDKR